MAMLSSPVSTNALSLFRCISSPYSTRKFPRKSSLSVAAAASSSSASHESQSATKTEKFGKVSSANAPLAESPEFPYSYALANPNGSPVVRFLQSTESTIERVIFDFRFLALLAIGGSLAGSVLCFLNGCVYIFEAYKVYWTSCVKGIHSGQMVLRLVEAIDVYLMGTVMLIFGMGLYGLFISNVAPDVPPSADRALTGSSLFGMFAMKERPKWMKISSLDELKTKVGHVIVMILLVKMFERSKMVTITTGLDLLSYSVCIFLSSLPCTFFTIFISRNKISSQIIECSLEHSQIFIDKEVKYVVHYSGEDALFIYLILLFLYYKRLVYQKCFSLKNRDF